MGYDYKILEEKFKQLPEELQMALTSIEITNAIKEIGNKHGLKLDQEEVLYDQTAYVMLGLSPSKDFVKNFSKEAGVDTDTASAIATDINNEVFGKIRTSMQAIQDKQQTREESAQPQPKPEQIRTQREISSIERAGGFSIDKSNENENENRASMRGKEINVINYGDKDKILDGIENPVPGKESAGPESEENHTEPLVDHLLNNATTQPEEKVAGKPSNKPPAPEPTKPETDSYREPIN